MTSSKQAILAVCPERLRQVPAQFSWVDQRLVRDRHLDRLDAYAAALYLFLVTVADAQGLSWYGDTSTARRLSIDEERLRRARADLVHAGLLAYAKPLYQVLALGDPLPSPAPLAAADTEALSAPAAPAPENAVVRERIKALHAALGRRP
jgi:hypothetical protein